MLAVRAVSCTLLRPLGFCQLYQLLLEEWVVQFMKYQYTECDFSVSPIGSSSDNSSGWSYLTAVFLVLHISCEITGFTQIC